MGPLIMAHQVEMIQQYYGAYCTGLTAAAQGLLQVAFQEARQGARGGPAALTNASTADLADELAVIDLVDTDSCQSDDPPIYPEEESWIYTPRSPEDMAWGFRGYHESNSDQEDDWIVIGRFRVPASDTKLHHLKMAVSVAWLMCVQDHQDSFLSCVNVCNRCALVHATTNSTGRISLQQQPRSPSSTNSH